jgi:hypothetical protein
VNGIDFALVTALVLLVALAVAAGLQLAQDRVQSHLAAVSTGIREHQPPAQYCVTCGREPQPPI